MSDHSISIVPKLSNYPDKEKKVKEILYWLVSLDIVKPTLSDCVLGPKHGYAISDGAKNIVNEPDYLHFGHITNGLEIIIKRQVFDTGENGMDLLICPNCKQDISSEDWDFFNEWANNESDNITCPICKVGTDIHRFDFTPEWGFSDLGFTFWNWPELSESFISDFKRKLDCEVNIVLTWR